MSPPFVSSSPIADFASSKSPLTEPSAPPFNPLIHSLSRAARLAESSRSRNVSPASTIRSHSRANTFSGDAGELGAKPDYSGEKIVVAMVGLPARGKSYLSNKLMRYLRVRLRVLFSFDSSTHVIS